MSHVDRFPDAGAANHSMTSDPLFDARSHEVVVAGVRKIHQLPETRRGRLVDREVDFVIDHQNLRAVVTAARAGDESRVAGDTIGGAADRGGQRCRRGVSDYVKAGLVVAFVIISPAFDANAP